jgi:branched-chain amino acid transport system permease protein
MDILIQQIINGLVLGSIYALVALGYTMVYGIMGLINFAHGEVVMIGAMVTLMMIKLMAASGLPTPLVVVIALGVAALACMLVGYTIERVAYRPLRHAPKLAPLITAIGVSIVLQHLAMLIWGRNYLSFPAIFPATQYEILGASITTVQVAIVLIAALMMCALLVLINRTRLGRAMRATSENPPIAQLMGVNINQIISLTFVIGSALAAVAGLMVSANYSIVHYAMGAMLGMKAFTAAVLGGIGNVVGAMLGGVLLGLIESLGAGYIGDLTGGVFGSNYQDVFAFLVLIGVLVFRPSGLIGEKVSERA